MRAVVVVASLTACFSKPPPPTGVTGDGGRDGSTSDGSTTTDAAALCAQWNPFGQPIEVDVTPIADMGAQHVTMSNDGLEMIYDLQGTLYESIRTSVAKSFATDAAVPGFDPVSGDEAAWLSPNRLILFYIESSSLLETNRPSSGDSFVMPGANVSGGVDDATSTNDRLRVVYSTNNALRLLKFGSADDPASSMDSPLLDNTPNEGDTAPSIGDHGRKLVWAKTNLVQPTGSVLVEGDFDGSQVTNPHDLLPDVGAFDTDPNLSDDGTTLYFTSTRNSGDPTPQLFIVTRTCH